MQHLHQGVKDDVYNVAAEEAIIPLEGPMMNKDL